MPTPADPGQVPLIGAPDHKPGPSASRALTAKPRIGLALGGGGARGLAHVPVLEVFDELGVRPHRIAGTSIGAIYGAAYAGGTSAAHIREATLSTLTDRVSMIRQLLGARSDPIGRLFRIVPRRSALLNPEAVIELVMPSRLPKTFADLEIPLQVTATDLATHRGVVLSDGPLLSAVAASISIPVLFSPVTRDGAMLLDGGLVNPCPYDLLMTDCDLVVAVDVSGATSEAAIGDQPSAVEVIVQSTQILQKSVTYERLKHLKPDLYFEVDLDRYGALEFHKAREILAACEPMKDQFRTRLQRLIGSENLPAT